MFCCSKGTEEMKLTYIYVDSESFTYCGWEHRVHEILQNDLDINVFPVPIHRCNREGRFPVPKEADVIFCSNPLTLEIAVEYKKRLNKLLVLQFLDIPIELFGSEQWRIQAYDRVKPLVKYADYLIAISKFTARQVEEWCGRKAHVLYIGCDADLFEIGKIRDLGYAVTVPRGLAKQKNYQEAIEITKDIVPLRVVYGQYSDIAKARIIKSCSFGIHTSRFEGFCIPVVEFCVARKPVIVRSLPVIEEIHKANKGVIIYNDVEEARRHITELMNNPSLRRKMGILGQKYVREKGLTLQQYAKNLKSFLESII
ncbi:MAG: glycosyltransferase family 4 protein [Bacillota bacterium]